jgi:hypothetical protein
MNKLLKWYAVVSIFLIIIGCSRKEIIGPIQYVDSDSKGHPPMFPISTSCSASIPYPNPFSDTCVVMLQCARSTVVDISILNSSHKEIKSIYSGNLVAGIYSYQWNGRNEQGEQCINGFYYFTLMSDSFQYSSVVLLKR